VTPKIALHAGKTTLLRTLTGALPPLSGEATTFVPLPQRLEVLSTPRQTPYHRSLRRLRTDGDRSRGTSGQTGCPGYGSGGGVLREPRTAEGEFGAPPGGVRRQ
jgi:energy-coupling factor transporter ATP-binding protein EcfA2